MSGRVWVAYTGGTIGMLPTESGFAPVPGAFPGKLRELLAAMGDELPSVEIEEFDPILDSANMRPEDWNRIAERVRDRYDDFDGFVVLHGTDTLAYTASALSFMLEGLRKPVVVTGSQIPFCRARSDARRNLIDALIIAGQFSIPEVGVLFDGKLYRGNRVTKVSADALDAFRSPNYGPLVRVGTSIEVDHDQVRRAPRGPLRVRTVGKARVGALRLFPGIDARVLENLLAPPIQGLVLEAYGVGNAPVRDLELVRVIREAGERGVVIAVCSQCLEGTVDLESYATGRALAEAGAIGVGDMTAEAAMTKLVYLLECEADAAAVRSRMVRSLRGELSGERS
ncbi:MAG: asparaginase [Planctomycetota bacterium]